MASAWLAFAGGGSLLLLVANAGQSIGRAAAPPRLPGPAPAGRGRRREILGRGDGAYATLSGLDAGGQLGRWLLVCGLLFGASTLLFLLSSRRSRYATIRRWRSRTPSAPPRCS